MPTTLSAGDIAFVSFQSNNSGGGYNGDGFQFVLLRSIDAGTTIYFTDNGYRTDTGTYTTTEEVVRWVAQSDLNAGTVITFVVPGGTPVANSAEWTGIVPTTGAVAASTSLNLITSGDNITALQSPTFGGAGAMGGTAIAAIHFGAANFASTYTGGTSQTGLPPGLVDGVSAVAVGPTSNGRYDENSAGSRESGSAAVVGTSINSDTNWVTASTPLTPHLTTASFVLPTAAADTITGDSADDLIDMLAGNDSYDGAGGADTITGGTGVDTLSGSAGDDLFLVSSGETASGESYDGGADNDTLQIDGGGTVDLTGVTFSNMENAIVTHAAGTRVILSTAQIAAVTGTLDAQGTSDTFAVNDLTFLGTFGTQATRASIFALITDLHAGGVENVEWQEGGATNVATKSGANVVVTSTDPAGNAGGHSWETSAFTFDGTTGERLTKVTTMDDASVVTRNFSGDAAVSEVTTNIPGPQATRTVLFDSAGRWDSVTAVNEDGSSVETRYDDSNRIDSRTDTAANGFATTTNFNDSNQRISIVSDDTASELHAWTTSTLTFNPANGQVTQKYTLLDNGNEITETYTAGQLATRVTVDGGVNEAFTSVTQRFTAGVFLWQAVVYDNNTGLIVGSDTANAISQSTGISDAIIGNGGADVFVFAVGGGADRVLDFSKAQGDKLDLRAFGIDQVAEITSYTQAGAHLIMNFGGSDSVQVNNLTYAALTNADFVV